MKKANAAPLRARTECSIMIALATVLSVIKIIDLPYGGSVTMASALPIAIAVYRHGWRWGLGVTVTNAVLQLLLGLENFSYVSGWKSMIALAIFDYILAFVVFALAAAFKNKIKSQSVAMALGVTLASFLRYLCHVISGAAIWAECELAVPNGAAVVYSLSYNATYMIPETVILALAAAYTFSALDFRKKVPTRVKSETADRVAAYSYLAAGLVVLGALITDTALVFSKLQDAETGERAFGNIGAVNFTALISVTAACAAVAAVLITVAKLRERRTAE